MLRLYILVISYLCEEKFTIITCKITTTLLIQHMIFILWVTEVYNHDAALMP